MEAVSLKRLALEQLERAQLSTNGRAAVTIYGGRKHQLRQTLIAIVGGEALADHANPGEATLQVLQGRVALTWAEDSLELGPDEQAEIPDAMHSVEALEDSAVLLTVSVHRQ